MYVKRKKPDFSGFFLLFVRLGRAVQGQLHRVVVRPNVEIDLLFGVGDLDLFGVGFQHCLQPFDDHALFLIGLTRCALLGGAVHGVVRRLLLGLDLFSTACLGLGGQFFDLLGGIFGVL